MACLTQTPTLPTAVQVERLSSLPPAIPPVPPSVHQLAPILSFLSPEWLRNFLFTPDPIHLDHLSSPFSSLVASLSATRIDPQKYDSHHLDNRFVYSPAFSVPPYTAGFGIMQTDMFHLENSEWNFVCAKTLPFRFVRDGETHSIVEVLHVPEFDVLVLSYFKTETTVRTSAISVFCTRSSLLEILRRCVSIPQDTQLQPAIQAITHEVQTHPCKVCASEHGECFCLLPQEKPRHPFDKEYFYRSMQLHLGEFNSVISKMQWVAMRCGVAEPDVRHIMMGSKARLRGVADGGFSRMIADLVVRSEREENGMVLSLEPMIMDGVLLDVMEKPCLEDVEWILDTSSTDDGSCPTTTASVGGMRTVEACEKEGEKEGGDGGEGGKEGKGEEKNEAGSEESKETGGGKEEGGKEEERKREERRKRARDRRERNRIAARKSNLKRKLFVDGLVSDVAQVKRRVEELRRKEMQLREENLNLRKMITDKEAHGAPHSEAAKEAAAR